MCTPVLARRASLTGVARWFGRGAVRVRTARRRGYRLTALLSRGRVTTAGRYSGFSSKVSETEFMQ